MSDRYAHPGADHLVLNGGVLAELPALPLGLSVAALIASWALVFRWIHLSDAVAGLGFATWLGLAHLLAAGSMLAVAGLSRRGHFETAADDRIGAVPAFWYSSIAFAATGLVASQTLGLGAVGWVSTSVVAGVFVASAVRATREDLGITVPTGALELLVGALLVLSVFGPEFTWQPAGFSASIVGPIAVATVSGVAGISTVWAAAVAYRDFGARGREFGAYAVITLSVAALLSILLLLVAFVVEKGLDPALKGATLWPPSVPFVTNGYGLQFDVNGIFPAIVGTVWLVVGAVALATPLGVGAAVYLTEYAEQGRFTAAVEVATNGLWSTPSIVYGLFGYAFLVPRLGNHSSILAGQLVLGFMLLPLVLITSREALQNVPDEYRDASAALGVGEWETVRSIVLPAAVPGVLTGIILGVGRIAGETAPILLVLTREPFLAEAPSVLGSFHLQSTPPFVVNEALLSSATALPYQLFAVITAGVGAPESFGWATAFVLLLVVLSLYAVGITTRIYFRRRLQQ